MWTSVAVMLVGAAIAGLGVVLLSWTVALAGAAVVLAGGLSAWQAGIMQDVRVKGGSGLERVADTGPGGHPSDTSISPAAAVAGRRSLSEGPDVATFASWVAVAAGAWLALAPSFLPYPFTSSGQDHLNRDRFIGVALVLAALPLARTFRLRPVVTVVAGLLAALLALIALSSRGVPPVVVNDGLVAAVVLTAVAVRVVSLTRNGRRGG